MITILTEEPVPCRNLPQRFRRFARVRYRRLVTMNSLGGHYAVTRSAIDGFRRCGFSFNYNPVCIDEVSDMVYVPGNIRALQTAIEMKRDRRIKRLVAGPNLVVLPHDHGRLIVSPEIDTCIVPAGWTKELYENDEPDLKGRISLWAAGVDERKWQPDKVVIPVEKILVYIKLAKGQLGIQNRVFEILHKLGRHFEVVRYGYYSEIEYRRHLQGSQAMIVLGGSESQCIAHAEAWSMDVPTFVWDSHDYPFSNLCSTVQPSPLLSNRTGALWHTILELRELVLSLDSGIYAPRKWIIENLTDHIAAEKLHDICLIQN